MSEFNGYDIELDLVEELSNSPPYRLCNTWCCIVPSQLLLMLGSAATTWYAVS
jgi:hypothetical protein